MEVSEVRGLVFSPHGNALVHAACCMLSGRIEGFIPLTRHTVCIEGHTWGDAPVPCIEVRTSIVYRDIIVCF
jgi:hypothetical protein